MVEDRAAKNFRSAVREKIEYKEQHQSSAFAYITSAVLVLIVLVIGITTVNNFDKMKAVQNRWKHFRKQSVADRLTQRQGPKPLKRRKQCKRSVWNGKESRRENDIRNIGRTTLRSGFLCSTERRNACGNQSEIIWRYVACEGNLQNEWAV